MKITTELGWVKCARCGVTQPPSALQYTQLPPENLVLDSLRHWNCKDRAKCTEWRADLAPLTPAPFPGPLLKRRTKSFRSSTRPRGAR
jgi:hypothetical protein